MALGKKLKKLGGKVLKHANPMTGFGLVPNLFKGDPGPANPYAPPDVSFLKNPMAENPYIKALSNTGTSGAGAFGELMKNINAPSSVDAVRGEVEGERLQSLLRGIDEDVARAAGDIKLDAEERGLGGPAMGSDIEFSSLGTARGAGARAKADSRLSFAGMELDRLKAREEAARGAYSDRYKFESADEAARRKLQALLQQQGIELQSGRETDMARIMADLYSGSADRQERGKKPSVLEDILRNINVNVGVGG